MPSVNSIDVAITRTQFGRLWEWRLGLILLFTAAHFFPSKKWWNVLSKSRVSQCVGAIVATTLLASLAWAGHAGASMGAQRFIQFTADAAHLVAAGVWPGGLLPLTFFLVRASRSNEPSLLLAAGAITRRFSALSILVVGALAATGLVNSYFLVGSLRALVTSAYGRLLMLKLSLFVIMIGFGARNLLCLKPRLTSTGERNAQQRVALSTLMRNVIVELCLGTLIVLIVGALGVAPPPGHMRTKKKSPKYGSSPLRDNDLDRFRGAKAGDTGITSVFLGPRLIASRGCWSVEVAGELPVSIDNTALQVVPDYRVRGAISIHF